MTIEVELRGIMNREEYNRALAVLKKKANFIKEKKRISFVYFRHGLCEDVKEYKDDPVDLRIRITNNEKAEIMLKHGEWGGEEHRTEISIPIDKNHFEEAIEFLKFLNWSVGIIVVAHTQVYSYENIEFAVAEAIPGHYYFEAEKTVETEEDSKKANKEIKTACAELGLKITGEKEFIDMVNSLNKIKENEFDFLKQKFSAFKEKFKDYF